MALLRRSRSTAQTSDITSSRLNHIPAILSIDSDAGARELQQWALSLAGMDVTMATSGMDGLALARLARFDLMLVEHRLPDLPGTDLVRFMRDQGVTFPFVLIGDGLSTSVTVEAMRLGARDVIDKPVEIDQLVVRVWQALGTGRKQDVRVVRSTLVTNGEPGPEAIHVPESRPGSAAERWALQVLKACESTKDLKTLEEWAAYIGVSYSSLRESCRMLGISAHDARDFMRMLRAVLKSGRHQCSPQVLLNVSDVRTLNKLLWRAGIRREADTGFTTHGYLRNQQFISRDNAGLRVLRVLLRQHCST